MSIIYMIIEFWLLLSIYGSCWFVTHQEVGIDSVTSLKITSYYVKYTHTHTHINNLVIGIKWPIEMCR